MSSMMTNPTSPITEASRRHRERIEALLATIRTMADENLAARRWKMSPAEQLNAEDRMHEIYWTLVRAAASLQGVEPYDVVDQLADLASRAKAEAESVQA